MTAGREIGLDGGYLGLGFRIDEELQRKERKGKEKGPTEKKKKWRNRVKIERRGMRHGSALIFSWLARLIPPVL